eukprot:scaffold33620_cov151-Skeletonema_dohrnii-CCMP3373.AAC.2
MAEFGVRYKEAANIILECYYYRGYCWTLALTPPCSWQVENLAIAMPGSDKPALFDRAASESEPLSLSASDLIAKEC